MTPPTKHTQGPWHLQYSPYKLGAPIVVGQDDVEPIAYIPSKDNMANARLIAASPELLEALRVLVDHAQETYPHFESERGQQDIQAALVAIAKAEGRTT